MEADVEYKMGGRVHLSNVTEVKESKDYYHIENDGCISLIEKKYVVKITVIGEKKK